MSITNLFSLRKRPTPSSVSYELSPLFRKQAFDILVRVVGRWDPISARYANDFITNKSWKMLWETVSLEHADYPRAGKNAPESCFLAIHQGSTELALDLIEFGFCLCTELESRQQTKYERQMCGVSCTPQEAISEFNARAEAQGIGFRFVDGMIVESASNYTHAAIVEPCLILLHDNGYQAAHNEFSQSLRHLRSGDFDSAITEATKALESVIKTICVKKNWKGKNGQEVQDLNADKLLGVLRENAFFPAHLDNSMAHLTNLLLGLTMTPATIRNKAAHGDGVAVKKVSREICEFAIHTAASNILLLASLGPKQA